MHRIAITTGDPAGIGPEIALRAAGSPDLRSRCELVLVGTRSLLERCAAVVGVPWPDGLVVEDVPVPGLDGLKPGVVAEVGGRAAYEYTRRACAMGLTGAVDAIVTAPINKPSLRAAGCPHIGHTEMLADEFGVTDPLTVFVTGTLRVFFLSRHLSLRQAVEYVRGPHLVRTLRQVHSAMRDLGFREPRIAAAGLNPHSGDGGQFGDEEITEIAPAVSELRDEGLAVEGPIAADSVFHLALEGAYDCVLSLYHDQGHIACKTRDFYGTVTATLGLPVLRTSVDHGTAFDIAWTGRANEKSLIKAVEAAEDLLSVRA